MNEIVEAKENNLLSEDDINFLRTYDEITKRYKVWESEKKDMFKEFLDKNNLDSYSQGGYTLYRTKSYMRKSVDTNKMKEEGVYDLYLKETYVEGSVKIKAEYEE